jgi:hypothetical protein
LFLCLFCRDSFYCHRYNYVLSSYIEEGKLSIISTADPDSSKESSVHPMHDDVSGFAGVQLHDSFADTFFMNTCLSKMKGFAQYILSIKSNQFIVPTELNVSSSLSWLYQTVKKQLPRQIDQIIASKKKPQTTSTLVSSKGYHAKYEYLHMNQSRYRHRKEHLHGKQSISLQHMDHEQQHLTAASTTRVHSSSSSSSAAAHNHAKTIALEQSLSSLSLFLKHQSEVDFEWVFPACSIRLPTTFVHTDPADSFSPWGPGDTAWTKDFYQSSPAVVVNEEYSFAVKLISTKATMAIDVLEHGEVVPICNDLSTLHHSHRRGGRHNHTTATVTAKEVIEFTLPANLASIHVFQESFSTSASATSKSNEDWKPFFEQIHRKIAERFSSTENDTSTLHTTTTNAVSKQSLATVRKKIESAKMVHEARHGKESGGGKDRRDVKPPFWQHCNTEHLADVIERILPPSS